MSQWDLAQLNIAQPIAPLDSAVMAEFVANLDRINAVADGFDGFIWRLKDDSDDPSSVSEPFPSETIINLSVWESVKALHNYVYHSAHIEVMRRRKAWFEHSVQASAVLWWVPRGHIPNLYEAREKLTLLNKMGPSQDAFTFKSRMPKPQN